MRDTLLSILLVGGILVVSFVLTQLFARAMYLTCPGCGTLNARRREVCRSCGEVLRESAERKGSGDGEGP